MKIISWRGRAMGGAWLLGMKETVINWGVALIELITISMLKIELMCLKTLRMMSRIKMMKSKIAFFQDCRQLKIR